MKNLFIVKAILILNVSAIFHTSACAQDSATYKRAEDNFGSGCFFFNQNQYKRAINYFRASNNAVPTPVTWYYLGLAYNRLNDPKDAFNAMTVALDFRDPALAGKFINTAESIKTDSWNQINHKSYVGGDALKVKPVVPTEADKPSFVPKRIKSRRNGG